MLKYLNNVFINHEYAIQYMIDRIKIAFLPIYFNFNLYNFLDIINFQ